MKKTLLVALLIPVLGFGQTVRNSTANGDFLNPLNWNPIGVPASGDSLYIGHDMTMTTDIYYTSGRITINPGGSLIEDATDRNFWADGTGSVVNSGTFTTHLLLLSPGAVFTNHGSFINIDSLWNQGTVTNSVTGWAELYDFWNDQSGLFINNGVLSNADSLLNQGSFTNTASATIYDFLNDQMADFTNSGNMTITHDMNNQGYAHNQAGIILNNNFSNCNIQTMDAMFINDGRFCIGNDFANCFDDTLTGTGSYYIGGQSSNLGVIDGTHTMYTTTGSLDIAGNIQPGVSVMQGTCNLELEEEEIAFGAYPNPVHTELALTVNNENYRLYDLTGKVIKKGMISDHTIDMTDLRSGVYLLKVGEHETLRLIKR